MNYRKKRSIYSNDNNCLIDPENRYCKHNCGQCGFSRTEDKKRKAMIAGKKFKQDRKTGLLRIVIPSERNEG